MRTVALIAILSSTLFPIAASGARFPNAVEKTVVVTGDAATLVAGLLGLSSAGARSATLQLGRNDAWAVYLLKHDTKHEITNGDGPPRYNAAKFSPAGGAALSIGNYWLDLATQLPDSKPGYYSFGSPFLSETLSGNDAWSKLVRRLRDEPGWNRGATPRFERCLTSPERTEICIRVYGAKDYPNNVERNGYYVTITVHPSR